MLTFELNKDGDQLEIHADSAGMDRLIAALRRVAATKNHEHMATPSWRGTELSEELQSQGSSLLNSVSIYMWPD
ncbi:MAG: immunity protein 32 [Acidobacteria bacterium]|nr:immunity protein 32 [Acidobacteriota bacterium]